MANILNKLQKIIKKNKPQAVAFITGRMPSFIYGARKFKDIPIFCFHSAKYPLFESQLQFLNSNGYKTLTADELYERLRDKNYKNNGKEIALTFDDGMASVWTTAYPLLKKYDQKIISFILPGLMIDNEEVGATIDDVNNDDEKMALSNRDYGDRPLCNWNEIKIMHESGLVDIQSHGMYHALINTSPTIVDFIHPDFDAYHYGNIHIPIYQDSDGNESREKILGHPVYEHASRLSGKSRYLDPFNLRQICAAYVIEQGSERFFTQANWRHKLNKIVSDYQNNNKIIDDYELEVQTQAAIEAELFDSKQQIEKRLDKHVNHFCFPWFVASLKCAVMSGECGYKVIHLGELRGFTSSSNDNLPVTINRLQEEYLLTLPGVDNSTLYRVLKSKII